ncbi:MAG: vWA domain-containing protein [Myxococcota bacterium]
MARSWGVAAVVLSGCSIENTILPGHATDVFYQEVVDQVDILFVVDNSASMAEEQEALASGFGSFIGELETANSNFHVGVVSTSQDTTDPERGQLLGDPPYLTAEVPDYVTEFQDRVSMGVGGSDKEKGLEAAAVAVSPELAIGYNQGFLRADANLLIVMVSDEEDCSDDGRLDGQDASSCYAERGALVPVSHMVARIADAKANGELVQIASIVGPYDSSCPDAYPGTRYVEAALQTGGLLGRICDQDWSNVLYDVGLNAVGILDRFKLTNAADMASLVVTVDGQPVPNSEVDGWTYDWQYWLILFHGAAVPARGSEIVVEYDIAPSAGAPLE